MRDFNSPINKKNLVVLEFSSFVKKDLEASVDLADKFIHALRRWILARSKERPEFYDFARSLSWKPAIKASGSINRFTVIRSPFVYKKTREQFGLHKRTYYIRLNFAKTQKIMFVQWVSQLKMPAELKIHFH